MSGGAIWSVFAKGTGEIADLEFVTAVPEFVMFWEEKLDDGKFSITAHGPRSIQHLVESVRARWP